MLVSVSCRRKLTSLTSRSALSTAQLRLPFVAHDTDPNHIRAPRRRVPDRDRDRGDLGRGRSHLSRTGKRMRLGGALVERDRSVVCGGGEGWLNGRSAGGRLRNFRCEARWHWVAKQLQTVEGQQKETSWEHYRVKAAPFFPDIHIHRDNSGFSPDGRVWSLDFEMFGSSRIRVCLKQFFGI